MLDLKGRQIQIEQNIDLELQLNLENINLSSREVWSLINEEKDGFGSLEGRRGCAVGLGAHKDRQREPGAVSYSQIAAKIKLKSGWRRTQAP